MVNNNTASAPFPGDDGKNTIDTTAVQSSSPGSAADVHTAPDSSPTRAMPTASDTQAMPTETMPQQEGKPQQAWQDQQDASAQYASEAYRNSYPGSGSIPPQGSGRPGPQYPGWDQYSGYPEHRRRRPRIYYKKGPYTMTVVWGIFLVLLGIIGIFSILRVTDFISQDYMAFLGIVCCILVGAAIIIGGIIAAVSRDRRKAEDGTDEYGAEGDPDDYSGGYSDDYREQGYANYPSPSQGQGAMPGEAEGPGSSSAPMTVDAAAPDSTGNPANAAR